MNDFYFNQIISAIREKEAVAPFEINLLQSLGVPAYEFVQRSENIYAFLYQVENYWKEH
ncbi:hypothetical protein [Parabacteroides provencensis]|uniref:hypothetical protein n=1 Tax=Parabacteroides provencensis TaxID=1944636 RepID=UPI0013042A5B|nr:hypothetical protein [Parabacteroides provencensis]